MDDHKPSHTNLCYITSSILWTIPDELFHILLLIIYNIAMLYIIKTCQHLIPTLNRVDSELLCKALNEESRTYIRPQKQNKTHYKRVGSNDSTHNSISLPQASLTQTKTRKTQSAEILYASVNSLIFNYFS